MMETLGIALLLATATAPGMEAASLQDRTPAEWVARLAGDDPEEAITALAGLGSEAAAPPLVECVRLRPLEHAWQAARAFGALAATAGPKDPSLGAAAKELASLVADAEQDVYRRRLAALAIGRLGAQAKPALATLSELLGDHDLPPRIGLGATLALGAAGKDAVSALQRNLRRLELMKGLWTLSALAALGEKGSAMRKHVDRLVRDAKHFEAFVLSRAAIETLGWIGGERAAQIAHDRRVKIEKRRGWTTRGGGINWSVSIPSKPELAYIYLVIQLGWQDVPGHDEVALPAEFEEPMNGVRFTAGDALKGWFHHAQVEILELEGALLEDRYRTLVDFQLASQPLDRLLDFLDRMAALYGQ